MTSTTYIDSRLNELTYGCIFTYRDFIRKNTSIESIIKALNRRVASGKIAKIAKGKFYKLQQTIFGILKPSESEMIKDLLVENGERTGYITGITMYSRIGLTTQIAAVTVIGKNKVRPAFKRGYIRIHFIKQKNKITEDNFQLLQILDAIRYLKDIPDADIDFLCVRFLSILKNIPKDFQCKMVELAIIYPPATRALLGVLLYELGAMDITEPLYNSLNPITIYKLPKASEVLSNTKKWNIK